MELENMLLRITDGKNNLKFVRFENNDVEENDSTIFECIRDVCSLHAEIKDKKVNFSPRFVWNTGERSFSVDDITDEYLEHMKDIIVHVKLPTIIYARFADILWVIGKEYEYADRAVCAYYQLFETYKDANHWTIGLFYIRRAMMIAAETNNKKRKEQIETSIVSFLKELDGSDPLFCSIQLVSLLLDFKFQNLEFLLEILEKIEFNSIHQVNRREAAYEQKLRCLKGTQQINEKLDMATFYEQEADDCLKQGNIQNLMQAQEYLEHAVQILSDIGNSSERIRVHKRLVKVQKGIPEMIPVHSFQLDVKDLYKYFSDCVDGLSFEEAIVRLSFMVPFYQYEEERKKLLANEDQSFFENMFPSKRLNERGQTVYSSPQLKLDEEESIISHLHERYLRNEKFFDVYGKAMISVLNEHYEINLQNLYFLVKNNGIIPSGRESVIQNGIYLFLKGDCYSAIHILAPQMENIFRQIANDAGALTVKLKDGISEDILLSSVFELEELKDVYDYNLIFLFRGLLNEKAGANIRNEIAHGLMNQQEGNSGASIYFVWAVIKLLTWTSGECMKVISNNSKLFQLPETNGSLIKIIE